MAHNLIFSILTCQFVQHWQVEQVCHGCQDVWSRSPCLVLNWTVGHRGGMEQKLALKSGIQMFFFHSLNHRPSDVLSFLWKKLKIFGFYVKSQCAILNSVIWHFFVYWKDRMKIVITIIDEIFSDHDILYIEMIFPMVKNGT